MHRLAFALSLLLALTAAASNDLSGLVVDKAVFKPIPEAHVYVYSAFPKIGLSAICPSCYRDCGKQEKADAKGGFRIASLDPTLVFDLLAVADGYEPAFVRRIDPKGGTVTIELTPRSAEDANRLISGTVVDPDGKPVIGAMVEPNGYRVGSRIGYGNIPGVDKLSITNAKGEFALRVPDTAGKLDVRVTGRALAPRIERSLLPGQPRRIALTPGATISGRILRDGKPVAALPVQIVQKSRISSNFLGRFEIATNEDGLFVMTNVGPNDTYVISAPVSGGGVVEAKVVEVGADETTADAGTLPVVPGRRIAGTVVLPEGLAMRPATIVLSPENGGAFYTAPIGSDGKFVFNAVPHSAAVVSLSLRGATIAPQSTFYSLNEEEITVPAGEDCLDVRVVVALE